jgi:hypothetical protein
MIENIARIGNFTSSKIAALMTNGKKAGEMSAPAKTYIEEKNMERRLGRSISTEISSKATSWGKLVEGVAFMLLPNGYVLTSTDTIVHPEIPYWSGSPDGENIETSTIVDVKCPNTLKSFCQFVDCKNIEEIRENHKDGDTYYWQIVSNAILTGMKYGELIIYCPYKRELDTIRDFAANYDGNQKKFEWISMWAEDNDLPYLIEGKHYKNLNIIRFEIPQSDKDALTSRVREAGAMLIDMDPIVVKKVKPTKEQIAEAQEKIKMMNELRNRLMK